MNKVVEKELESAPKDWEATVRLLRERQDDLKSWLGNETIEQFVLVGDEDTEGLAHWAARTLGLISQGVIWGSSEASLLAADSPPTAATSSTLVIFLTRRGGSSNAVKVCAKMDQWFNRNKKIALMSSPGVLSQKTDQSVVFGLAEQTAIPTLTPTRLMVALMTLGAIITGKDVLTKRAELLSQWYVPTPAAQMAHIIGDSPGTLRVAAPKRLFSHCLPIKQLLEASGAPFQSIIDLDSTTPIDHKGTILGITAKSSEDQDQKALAKLRSADTRVVAFSSKAPDNADGHVALSRRTTDIGRTIHALLNVQKLLLCSRVRKKMAI